MEQKILGIDFGSVRIGLAVSDGLGLLAHPLQTLFWKNKERLVKDLKVIINNKNISKIVVGMPYNMKGKNSPQTDKVILLVNFLRDEFTIPIDTVDERLTTRMAENMLRDAGKKASRNRDIIDQMAAVNILQLYLDKNRN